MGRSDDALPHLESALALARSLGHARLAATVLCTLGLLNEAAGRVDAALSLHESAVATAHRHGDRRMEALFRAYWGRLLARQGRIDAARACLDGGDAALAGTDDALTRGLLQCAHAETEHRAADFTSAHDWLMRASTSHADSEAGPNSELARELARLRALFTEPVNRD